MKENKKSVTGKELFCIGQRVDMRVCDSHDFNANARLRQWHQICYALYINKQIFKIYGRYRSVVICLQ